MTTLNVLSAYSGLNPILDVESSTANSVYTLPTGANIQAGQRVKVANTAANSGNFPIVSVNASDATLVRSVYAQTDAEFVALQANPTNQAHWLALGMVVSNWITYAPSIKGSTSDPGLGSGSTSQGAWRRVGNVIEATTQIVGGTGTSIGSGAYYWPLPSGLAIDTTMPTGGDAGGAPVGQSSNAGSGGGGFILYSVHLANLGGSAGTQVHLVDSVGNAVGATNGAPMADNRRYGVMYKVWVSGWSATRG